MKLPARFSDRLHQAIRTEQEHNPAVDELRKRLRAAENRVDVLEARVAMLANELTDARYQGRRAAEIADLVTELLSNEASRRDPEFLRILERYTGAR